MLRLVFSLAAAELENTPPIPSSAEAAWSETKFEIARVCDGATGQPMQNDSSRCLASNAGSGVEDDTTNSSRGKVSAFLQHQTIFPRCRSCSRAGNGDFLPVARNGLVSTFRLVAAGRAISATEPGCR
jgi:hypothetical protein